MTNRKRWIRERKNSRYLIRDGVSKRLSWQHCQNCSNSLLCQPLQLQAALFGCSDGWLFHMVPVLVFLQIHMSWEGNLCLIGHVRLTYLVVGYGRWEKARVLKGGSEIWCHPHRAHTSAIYLMKMPLTPCPTSIRAGGVGARDLPGNPVGLCLGRAAVLCLVFWPNSSIRQGLFTVLVKFQSAAYATSAHYVCFCVLWKCCCCCYYFYYYYYYALEVWVRSKSLLGAVLCTKYARKCCLPSRACSLSLPMRSAVLPGHVLIAVQAENVILYP